MGGRPADTQVRGALAPRSAAAATAPLLLLWRPHAGFPLLSRSFLEEPCGELEYRCHSTRRHVPSLLWGPPSRPSSVWQRRRCGKAGAAAGRVGAHGPRGRSLRPPCVSAAAPNRVLENGHTGETRLALRDPAREPAAPTPWLPVLSLTCSGQACRVSPSSQESGSSSGLRGHTCLHELSAQVRSAGWWGRTAGRASWGPDSSSLYTGDVPWEGPFTSQVRKEVARLQQRPFPLPHHKSSRPNDT